MDHQYYPVSYEEKYNATVYRVPLAVNEAVLRNAEDDGVTVYLNENLTDEEAKAAFQHAVSHDQNRDFEKVDVQQIEAAAHEEAPASPKEPEKKPKLKKKKQKRVFSQLDLDLLKADPWIADLLGIPKNEIPQKPTALRYSKKEYEAFVDEQNWNKQAGEEKELGRI